MVQKTNEVHDSPDCVFILTEGDSRREIRRKEWESKKQEWERGRIKLLAK